MVDLNTLADLPEGWQLTWPKAINDLDQILVTGTNGTDSADFLLTPTSNFSVPVVSGNGDPTTVVALGGASVIGGVSATFQGVSGLFQCFFSPDDPEAWEGNTSAFNFSLPGATQAQAWNINFAGDDLGSSTAQITLAYDPSLLEPGFNETDLRIYNYHNGGWVVPPNQSVDPEENTISFETDQFSPFMLGVVTETYNDWVSRYPGASADLTADDDGDGIDNGVENFFGTDPGAFSTGLTALMVDGDTVAFKHPQGNLATDLVATYRWSKNLVSFHAGGETVDGTTVEFSRHPTTNVPGTMATVTATVSGNPLHRFFVDVVVTPK